jgi:hypothetical protein
MASVRVSLALALSLCGCSVASGPVPTAPMEPNALQRAAGADVKFYPVKPAAAGPLYITRGPDGALWFT